MAIKTVDKIVNNLAAEDFVLDKNKYPDVEETPYGFIYNVNGRSITDQGAMKRKFGFGSDSGFTLNTPDNDESYYDDFESAYKAAKGIK